MLYAWVVALALVVADPQARPAEPQIRAHDGEVTLHVQNLPLSQILDRLSAATGMTLTYEGSRPATQVTMSVDKVSEVEAILPTLRRVRMLLDAARD